MSTEDIRKKLVGGAPAAEKLVELLLEDTLSRRLGELLPPAGTATAVVEGLKAWVGSDGALRFQLALGERGREWLERQRMTVGQLTGRGVEDAFLDLVARPVPPNREILLFLLDREPMRLLLRELFLDALLAFGRKVRAPVASHPLAKGLGGLGRMARDRARATTLGAIASDVADRLSDEMERQLEKKAVDFADAALEGLIAKLVDLLSRPERAEQQAALLEALVEGLFALEAGEIAGELERTDPELRTTILRRGLGAWASSDEAIPQIRDVVEALLEGEEERKLGDLLDELGLLDTWRDLAGQSLRRRLFPFLEGEAFAAWLEELLG